jgi:hypothetical protein
MKILLAITFVFGVLKFLRISIRPGTSDMFFFGSIFAIKNRNNTVIGGLLVWFDVAFFYFSLCFQSYYWLFK